MEFSCPQPAVFTNVQALNKAYLQYLCGLASGRHQRRMFGIDIEPLVSALTAMQIRRLSEAPFLLFSLREDDDPFWSRLLAPGPNQDLFEPKKPLSDEGCQITNAALGFLWNLSLSNPYAARVLCGATQAWCEQLARSTLLHLIGCAARHRDILVPRLASNDILWRKLLVAGISSEVGVRTAAQQCVLQTMLIEANNTNYQALPAAACRMPDRALQVAETTRARSKRKKS